MEECDGVLHHGWPVETLTGCFSFRGSGCEVVSAYPCMDLFQDDGSFISGDAFE